MNSKFSVVNLFAKQTKSSRKSTKCIEKKTSAYNKRKKKKYIKEKQMKLNITRIRKIIYLWNIDMDLHDANFYTLEISESTASGSSLTKNGCELST